MRARVVYAIFNIEFVRAVQAKLSRHVSNTKSKTTRAKKKFKQNTKIYIDTCI